MRGVLVNALPTVVGLLRFSNVHSVVAVVKYIRNQCYSGKAVRAR